jgi:hypothetical protein
MNDAMVENLKEVNGELRNSGTSLKPLAENQRIHSVPAFQHFRFKPPFFLLIDS